ncbi:MAG TPA: molecular chaperone HtpG [Leptospiraceae bacterium]|nr:molecular chaperone HtpG [Leptospirales bacterium]HMU82527.1 molecular chaperone HtpG [Leptospiraceae bacterium]HMX56736.1 molecular chaperone HtpG [Leptospiraceae bacterium]HMZ36067.1 molecular chaperone HtpG [Leptospiraceae bacterium]HNE23258.1 molecular chaperone HtpG [Leptospiraceae bacterium]
MSTLQKGKLSIQTGNILPVIKKWLYSEKEIYMRELVSNAFDAITKLRKVSLHEDIFGADDQDFAIDIHIDREKGILTIEDNGIGMTAEEIQKYISQIAFSGAEEFVKKYEQKDGHGIIGHFGLGFYSAFMVAKRVEIDTRSYKPDAEAAYWTSEGGEEYESGPGSRTKRGTEIRLHMDDESKSHLDKLEVTELVRKYCDFLAVPVRVDGSQVNRKDALWSKQPNQVQKEEYVEFYKYLFPHQGDPLFHIHLNVDHPFRLQGILYFPRMLHELDVNKNGVRIFCRNIFVSDEAQEILPKYLTMLQGVVDLPDLPLNVSRSYVQTDPEIRKIASHITKKVADRLNEEFTKNRTQYEQIWREIGPFVKYAMLSDEKFYDQAKASVLFEIAGQENKFCTIEEYQLQNKERAQEKIYYASDLIQQAGPMQMLKEQGIEAVYLPQVIDTHFIQFLESKGIGVHFTRVDAELAEHIVDAGASSKIVDPDAKSSEDRVRELFTKALANPKVTIRIESLKNDQVPALILLPEFMRRMSEMAAVYKMQDAKMGEEHTLVLNLKHPLIQALSRPGILAGEGPSKQERVARAIYGLARLSQGAVQPEEIGKFTGETYELLASVI